LRDGGRASAVFLVAIATNERGGRKIVDGAVAAVVSPASWAAFRRGLEDRSWLAARDGPDAEHAATEVVVECDQVAGPRSPSGPAGGCHR